jgi:hypothetical protein
VERLKNFISDHKSILTKTYQIAIYGLLLSILIYQLVDIGFQNLLQATPTNPLVYIIAVVLFFVLPVSEYFGYSRFIPLGFRESIPVFIKKRVINKNLINYWGEFDFYVWLTKRMPHLTKRQLFDIIKDNNIISSIASIIIVVGLLFFLVFYYDMSSLVGSSWNLIAYTLLGLSLFALLITISKKYRVYSLNLADTLFLTNLHVSRMLFSSVLQILQWYLAISDVTLFELFIFLAVQLVISRIPMLPGKDLLFISGSLMLTNYIPVSVEELAAIMILNNIIDKILSIGSLSVISFNNRSGLKSV